MHYITVASVYNSVLRGILGRVTNPLTKVCLVRTWPQDEHMGEFLSIFIVPSPCFLPENSDSAHQRKWTAQWWNYIIWGCFMHHKKAPSILDGSRPPFLRTSPLHCAEDVVVNLQPLNIYHCLCCPDPLLSLSLFLSFEQIYLLSSPFVLQPDRPSFVPTPFFCFLYSVQSKQFNHESFFMNAISEVLVFPNL